MKPLTITWLLSVLISFVAGCSSYHPTVVVAEPFKPESTPAPRDDLIVFVGRKISVEEFEPKNEEGYILMDLAFLARYDVLSVERGELANQTIQFEAYDHYGRPGFSRYETVVLFVSQAGDGTYFHEKYQYIPVYPTVDGRWASCGDPYLLEPDVHRGDIEARDIEFNPPLKFDLGGLSRRETRKRFPRAYYRLTRTTAECVRGNSVEELLKVKFEGVLGARGYTDSSADH